MQSRWQTLLWCGPVILAVGGVLALAQTQPADKKEEQERKVKEAEVPPAALAALKKLAGGATLTEFAEEIEHGHKFYEGSWKGPDGNVDGLVTETGDVVEIEESIPPDKVPAAARAAVEKEAGKDATAKYERKTFFVYEAHFKKDGKGREIIFTPDGRRYHEEGEGAGEPKGKPEGEDEDED
ncbi:MAG: hypothetical protein V2A79_17650 [Planctomycetota bacterium]